MTVQEKAMIKVAHALNRALLSNEIDSLEFAKLKSEIFTLHFIVRANSYIGEVWRASNFLFVVVEPTDFGMVIAKYFTAEDNTPANVINHKEPTTQINNPVINGDFHM